LSVSFDCGDGPWKRCFLDTETVRVKSNGVREFDN
jgi:hypothetical protein